ncbi:hypothetical protein M3Y97_00793700 [Aphelenchoides bicaudatus]|nr:hypothetical protein M3Y97_00793700 [Aphelenchoides bicaudatus]
MLDILKGIKAKNETDEPEKITWLTSKRHFRETEAWKQKRKRIIMKIRVMGKFNLAFLLSKAPFLQFLQIAVASFV